MITMHINGIPYCLTSSTMTSALPSASDPFPLIWNMEDVQDAVWDEAL
jgi:hypothetical protein